MQNEYEIFIKTCTNKYTEENDPMLRYLVDEMQECESLQCRFMSLLDQLYFLLKSSKTKRL